MYKVGSTEARDGVLSIPCYHIFLHISHSQIRYATCFLKGRMKKIKKESTGKCDMFPWKTQAATVGVGQGGIKTSWLLC